MAIMWSRTLRPCRVVNRANMSSSMASMRRRRWFLFVVSPGAVRFHAFGAPVVGGGEMGGKRLGGAVGCGGLASSFLRVPPNVRQIDAARFYETRMQKRVGPILCGIACCSPAVF